MKLDEFLEDIGNCSGDRLERKYGMGYFSIYMGCDIRTFLRYVRSSGKYKKPDKSRFKEIRAEERNKGRHVYEYTPTSVLVNIKGIDPEYARKQILFFQEHYFDDKSLEELSQKLGEYKCSVLPDADLFIYGMSAAFENIAAAVIDIGRFVRDENIPYLFLPNHCDNLDKIIISPRK